VKPIVLPAAATEQNMHQTNACASRVIIARKAKSPRRGIAKQGISALKNPQMKKGIQLIVITKLNIDVPVAIHAFVPKPTIVPPDPQATGGDLLMLIQATVAPPAQIAFVPWDTTVQMGPKIPREATFLILATLPMDVLPMIPGLLTGLLMGIINANAPRDIIATKM
jgi:hypothetical protein